MRLYKTVEKEASAELVIEKSRFIAYVKPVSTKEEADAFIAYIKKKHKDATHNVPAMVIGDKMQVQWASDDGEPQGTSGAPIVKMLVNAEITDVVIVVTRYFGGIKLGTGGLARAYTSVAKSGLEAAVICDVFQQVCLTYEFDYTYLAKLQNMAGEIFDMSNMRYTDTVEADFTCFPADREELQAAVSNVTGGRAVLKNEDLIFIKKKWEEF